MRSFRGCGVNERIVRLTSIFDSSLLFQCLTMQLPCSRTQIRGHPYMLYSEKAWSDVLKERDFRSHQICKIIVLISNLSLPQQRWDYSRSQGTVKLVRLMAATRGRFW